MLPAASGEDGGDRFGEHGTGAPAQPEPPKPRVHRNGATPVGKLRNDRFIPLHPDLVALLAGWTATNADHIRAQGRLLADGHVPIYRRTVHRIVARIGVNAGIGPVHPHQLRHTLATQAINRGMRLEGIAALLGHRSLETDLVYARIADRVVADEYESVCEQIDALYNTAATPAPCPSRSRRPP